jgi:hypothetical protein
MAMDILFHPPTMAHGAMSKTNEELGSNSFIEISPLNTYVLPEYT